MNKEKEKKKGPIDQRWTPEQEQLLAEWSEKASGYRWLHSRAEKQYRCRNYTFTIPVIILSTLTGTANFAMDSFVPEEYKQIAMAGVGSVNIFAGILSTLQNFLRYAELMEGHRLALVSWSKFSRDIAVELALEPKMRKPAFEFLSICRAEFDRLIEQSPSIDDDIIKQFKKVFKNPEVRVPEICNGIHPVKIYIPSKEEKVADILSKATDKMTTKTKSWRNISVNKVNTIKDNHVKWDGENKSKSDLSDLQNLGKVSLFKNKISKNNDEDLTPNNEIKKLVNKNNELEEKSIDEKFIGENDIGEKSIEENDIEKNIIIKETTNINSTDINSNKDICDREDIEKLLPNKLKSEKQIITKIEEIELNEDILDSKEPNPEITSFLKGIKDE
jgi:hypothetical protein